MVLVKKQNYPVEMTLIRVTCNSIDIILLYSVFYSRAILCLNSVGSFYFGLC